MHTMTTNGRLHQSKFFTEKSGERNFTQSRVTTHSPLNVLFLYSHSLISQFFCVEHSPPLVPSGRSDQFILPPSDYIIVIFLRKLLKKIFMISVTANFGHDQPYLPFEILWRFNSNENFNWLSVVDWLP